MGEEKRIRVPTLSVGIIEETQTNTHSPPENRYYYYYLTSGEYKNRNCESWESPHRQLEGLATPLLLVERRLFCLECHKKISSFPERQPPSRWMYWDHFLPLPLRLSLYVWTLPCTQPLEFNTQFVRGWKLELGVLK